jgi:flagellar basal body P-ring formation protein FlgA
MSNRLLIVVLAAFFVLLFINQRAQSSTGEIPLLRADVVVDRAEVRLGDLLDNAGEAASIAVFHAPELGTTGTIQTFRIIEAARQNGIAYFDTRGLSEITITRTARTLAISDLERAVAEAAQKHLGIADIDDIAVRFDRDVRAIQVEPNAAGTPRVARFSYDSYTRRFEGIVELHGSASLRKQPLRLSGTIIETAEIVVLARNVARGETLRESDILVERRPRTELSSDSLTRLAAVIGQAARRVLRGGQALRTADLMKPDLVGRNDTVTIVFEVPGITLTARGKALAAGAEGETIEVLNPHSKRVLHATVRGPGVVSVGRGHTVTADASGAKR